MKTILILAVLAVACAEDKSNPEPDSKAELQKPQVNTPQVIPDRVTVDHILIAVTGNPRMPQVKRTEAEAKQLVEDIRDRLDAGEGWDTLKQTYSDDPGRDGVRGGPYKMDAKQRPRDMERIQAGTFARSDMAKAFGDVSYDLQIGEIGVAEFDRNDSPFGFHIIKRIE